VAQPAEVVAAGFGAAVKSDRQHVVAPLDLPRVAVAPPVVGLLALIPVVDHLVKYAVVIADAIPVAGQVATGNGVHIARCQAAQATVAQAGIPLFLFEFVQVEPHLRKGLARLLLHAQADQVVLQKAARQELQGEKIDPFGQGVVEGALGLIQRSMSRSRTL
jgi:hypothetical protein